MVVMTIAQGELMNKNFLSLRDSISILNSKLDKNKDNYSRRIKQYDSTNSMMKNTIRRKDDIIDSISVVSDKYKEMKKFRNQILTSTMIFFGMIILLDNNLK